MSLRPPSIAGAPASAVQHARMGGTTGLVAPGPGLGSGAVVTAKKGVAPVQQLQMLHKRLGQLSRSIQELQNLMFSHPTLEDWPTLCSRYATLLSQLHSITASLTSPAPQFLSHQTTELANLLATESTTANLYAGQPVGTLLGAVGVEPDQLPRVRYRDATTVTASAPGSASPSASTNVHASASAVRSGPASTAAGRATATAGGAGPSGSAISIGNPLPALVVHPVQPLEDEQQIALLVNALLRTRLEPELEARREAQMRAVLADGRAHARARRRGGRAAATAAAAGDEHGEEGGADLLRDVRMQVEAHDQVVLTALRMWYHLERAPDEFGETYDWKMRISGGDDAVSGDEEEEDGTDEDGQDQKPAVATKDGDGDAIMQVQDESATAAVENGTSKLATLILWSPQQAVAYLSRGIKPS
ncbi:hypothetical protein K437DRAFT_273014 [Tilletiaria anomala UBC 951]|uniref:Mediator complex subunit 8 n=1 Tax=Tilletiaria anomala (strain ATCC 24038 / CBS 436.72 / UBC 951) TaxID=1037660 RepID=A0A066WBS6_TILAU|nr:uncharacterized protein K437DRAFT_273014 [Tilletiaria anomala UBC 951]KDN51367.1 hypothetical protein K437DRAFT_273014 [Tilletiaria anomala UBC 951]